TLLNALAAFIPDVERVVTVEDAVELRLPGLHVVRLEARPANAEGAGEVRLRDLVRNALRMRPDRIVVGEVRGPEALDMLQAMNTGHEGSLSTCHANSPPDALRRLETMVLMGDVALPLAAVRDQVRSALDLVVQVARRPGGRRTIVAVHDLRDQDGPAPPPRSAAPSQAPPSAGRFWPSALPRPPRCRPWRFCGPAGTRRQQRPRLLFRAPSKRSHGPCGPVDRCAKRSPRRPPAHRKRSAPSCASSLRRPSVARRSSRPSRR